MKVLIVEDEAETATYVIKDLGEYGHVVDHVSNGQDGFFAASTGGYMSLSLTACYRRSMGCHW